MLQISYIPVSSVANEVYFLSQCHLLLVHEVYLFARDATVAESWIAAHEPHIFSKYYGVS